MPSSLHPKCLITHWAVSHVLHWASCTSACWARVRVTVTVTASVIEFAVLDYMLDRL